MAIGNFSFGDAVEFLPLGGCLIELLLSFGTSGIQCLPVFFDGSPFLSIFFGESFSLSLVQDLLSALVFSLYVLAVLFRELLVLVVANLADCPFGVLLFFQAVHDCFVQPRLKLRPQIQVGLVSEQTLLLQIV